MRKNRGELMRWAVVYACCALAADGSQALGDVEVVLRNSTSSSADFWFQPLSTYPNTAAPPIAQRIQKRGQSKPAFRLPDEPAFQLRRIVPDGGERVFTIDIMTVVNEAKQRSAERPVVLDYRELVRIVPEQRSRTQTVTRYRPEERTRTYTATVMEPETKTRTVPVTKYRLETRTRTVKVYDPASRAYVDQERQVTVQVPYTEQVEVTYTTMVPTATEKTSTYTVQVPYTEEVEVQYTVEKEEVHAQLSAAGGPEVGYRMIAGGESAGVPIPLRRSLGVWLQDERGAAVGGVEERSPATRLRRAAGGGDYALRPRKDWILAVNDQSVTNTAEAVAAIQASDRNCRLLIRHGPNGSAEWYDVELDVVADGDATRRP